VCDIEEHAWRDSKESQNSLENKGLRQTEAQNSAQQGSASPAHQAAREPAAPNLDRIIDAWPTLPEPIRRAMLALAEACQEDRR
jgi:hypothetical protein